MYKPGLWFVPWSDLGNNDIISRDVSQSESKKAFVDVGKTKKLMRCLEITEGIILPISLLIFSLIYWTYALILYFGWRMKLLFPNYLMFDVDI